VHNDIENNLRTLGPNEAKVVLSFREQGGSVVAKADIISLLENKNTARKVVHSLLSKGWLTWLKRRSIPVLAPGIWP